MRGTRILRRAVSVLMAGAFGAGIWALAVFAAARYLTIDVSEQTFARLLKEFATPLGVLIAGIAVAVNILHQRYSRERENQQHRLEMALSWMNQAVEVVEACGAAADKDQPFYSSVTELQMRSAGQLIDAAERSASTLTEQRFKDRYYTDATYASARLLQTIRFRATNQFFDLRYYHVVQLGLRGRSELAESPHKSFSLASYHNDSVDRYEGFTGDVKSLSLDEAGQKDFRYFGFFLERLREGKRPFGHPYIGAAVPLEAAETVLRFALKQPRGTELKEVFPDDDTRVKWDTLGLGIVLYQCRYFAVDAGGKVFNMFREATNA